MKPATLLVALGSFAAGAVLALTASDLSARQDAAAKASVYTNAAYGFSLTPPTFDKPAKESGAQTAMFFAPVRNAFAANLGVNVQETKMSLDDYIELSKKQFAAAELTMISETRKKVSGRDAVAWEYEGTMKGRALRWSALAVSDPGRVYLLTGTAAKADFELVEKEFKACLESFKLAD